MASIGIPRVWLYNCSDARWHRPRVRPSSPDAGHAAARGAERPKLRWYGACPGGLSAPQHKAAFHGAARRLERMKMARPVAVSSGDAPWGRRLPAGIRGVRRAQAERSPGPGQRARGACWTSHRSTLPRREIRAGAQPHLRHFRGGQVESPPRDIDDRAGGGKAISQKGSTEASGFGLQGPGAPGCSSRNHAPAPGGSRGTPVRTGPRSGRVCSASKPEA